MHTNKYKHPGRSTVAFFPYLRSQNEHLHIPCLTARCELGHASAKANTETVDRIVLDCKIYLLRSNTVHLICTYLDSSYAHPALGNSPGTCRSLIVMTLFALLGISGRL